MKKKRSRPLLSEEFHYEIRKKAADERKTIVKTSEELAEMLRRERNAKKKVKFNIGF